MSLTSKEQKVKWFLVDLGDLENMENLEDSLLVLKLKPSLLVASEEGTNNKYTNEEPIRLPNSSVKWEELLWK